MATRQGWRWVGCPGLRSAWAAPLGVMTGCASGAGQDTAGKPCVMTTSGHRYDDRDQPDREEHEREAEQLVRSLRPRLLGDAQSSHSWASRQLHWLNELSASSAATAVAAAITVVSLVAALLVNSASKVLTGFEALSSGVTLVMIFTVQHTQSRQQAAVQRKLDELLRALPGTDQRLLHLESAPQAELDALDERHVTVRTQALNEDPTTPTS